MSVGLSNKRSKNRTHFIHSSDCGDIDNFQPFIRSLKDRRAHLSYNNHSGQLRHCYNESGSGDLNAPHVWTHNPHNNLGEFITSILQMSKLRHREVRWLVSSTVTIYFESPQSLQDTFQGQFRTKTDDFCVPCTGRNCGQTAGVDGGGSDLEGWGRKGTLSSTDYGSMEHWRSGEGGYLVWSQKVCSREPRGKLLWEEQSCAEPVVLEFLLRRFKREMIFCQLQCI